jgi:HEAT repeat protein
MKLPLASRSTRVAVAASILFLVGACLTPAAEPTAGSEKESRFISTITSSAGPAEKALACKNLAIYGSQAAVPALEPLLQDRELSSWARIALEAIPGAAADAALRGAAGRLEGRLLVGVLNSIGVRKDAKAVKTLEPHLESSDKDVATAAAVALGHIGGDEASKALLAALAKAPLDTRSGIALGCNICAETDLAAGDDVKAVKIYDTVRKSDVPKQRLLEATRGAILARKDKGLAILLEQLKSEDKDFFAIGLRVARELPGRNVTEKLAGELKSQSEERQPLLLLALAERADPTALPAVVAAAQNGSTALRIAAISALEQLGNSSTVPVLLDAAASPDTALASKAQTVLIRLPGEDVDAQLAAKLPQATGRMRQTLIAAAGQRGISAALPEIARSAQDPDPGIRSAAIQALGTLGDQTQIPQLLASLQKAKAGKDRDDIETAVLAISGRKGPSAVPALLPLAINSEAAMRTMSLHALASAGGPEALKAVKAATEDADESVQDEAVRTLSTWPNTWPDDSNIAEPLLSLAKSERKISHQVLAIRGYLQHIQVDKKLSPAEKAAAIGDILPVIKRPEEKRLAISTLRTISDVRSLELLNQLADEKPVTEDAISAIVALASKTDSPIAATDRSKALQTAIEKSDKESTKSKAEEALSKLK